MHQTHHDALKPIRQKPDSQGTNATACVLDCRAPDTHLENTAYISGAQASDQQPRKRRSPAQHAGRQLLSCKHICEAGHVLMGSDLSEHVFTLGLSQRLGVCKGPAGHQAVSPGSDRRSPGRALCCCALTCLLTVSAAPGAPLQRHIPWGPTQAPGRPHLKQGNVVGTVKWLADLCSELLTHRCP